MRRVDICGDQRVLCFIWRHEIMPRLVHVVHRRPWVCRHIMARRHVVMLEGNWIPVTKVRLLLIIIKRIWRQLHLHSLVLLLHMTGKLVKHRDIRLGNGGSGATSMWIVSIVQVDVNIKVLDMRVILPSSGCQHRVGRC